LTSSTAPGAGDLFHHRNFGGAERSDGAPHRGGARGRFARLLSQPLRGSRLAKSRAALERITGVAVTGFRMARLAPTDRGTIAAAGYRYNSSENPTWLPGRYNNLRSPRTAYLTAGCSTSDLGDAGGPLPALLAELKNLPWARIARASAWTLRHDGY